MSESTQERLEGLIKAVTAEDMLGGFIRAHLHIEFELNIFIQRRLPEGVLDMLRLEWRKKVDLAIKLGLLSDLKVPLRKVGNIRNDFAHNLGHQLTPDDVEDLMKSFSSTMKDLAQRGYAQSRKRPSHKDAPSTLHEMNPASKLQNCLLQIWAMLALINEPNFEPLKELPEGV